MDSGPSPTDQCIAIRKNTHVPAFTEFLSVYSSFGY
jgi:hypothetical protein